MQRGTRVIICHLAEVQEKRAEDTKLELLKRQLLLLEASSMYNFVRNYLKTVDVEAELSKKTIKNRLS